MPIGSSVVFCGLQTLTLNHNSLQTQADIAHLAAVPSVTALDLADNQLRDPAILDVLAAMPNLAVLYLSGNPVVKDIPHYRKTVVSRCCGLQYLDDRPVFPEERERCEAWWRTMHAEGARRRHRALHHGAQIRPGGRRGVVLQHALQGIDCGPDQMSVT